MVTNSQFVEFQQKIAVLKQLRRTGWCKRHVPKAETVAAHSWRMALMAMQQEAALKPLQVDMPTIIEMCLLHDVAEAVVGDIVPEHEQEPTARISKEQKKEMEARAIDDFAVRYDFPKLKKLFDEYEAQETLEAKVVKNLDKVDMLLQAYEYMTAYPALQGMHDFMNFNGKDVNLSVFAGALDEIKSRQFDHRVTPNAFLDFQMVAGQLKHLELTDTPDGETVVAHDWQTAVMLLHLEPDLTGQGVDVLKAVKLAVAHNMGKAVLNTVAPTLTQEVKATQQLSDDFGVPFVREAFDTVQQGKMPEAQVIRDLGVRQSGICRHIPVVHRERA